MTRGVCAVKNDVARRGRRSLFKQRGDHQPPTADTSTSATRLRARGKTHRGRLLLVHARDPDPASRWRLRVGVVTTAPWPDSMTEYEMAREERLARNREVLASLSIPTLAAATRADEDAGDDGPSDEKAARRRRRRRARATASGSAPDPPSRRSNRAEARRVKSYAEAGDDDPNIVDDDDDDDFFSSDEDDAGSSGEDDGAPGDTAEARAADEDDSSVEILELDEEEREDDDGIRDAAKAPVASAPKRRKRDDASPRARPPPSEPSPKPKPKPKSKSARVADVRAPSRSDVADAFVAMLAPSSAVALRRGAMRLEDARLGLHELRATADAHGFGDWTDDELASMLSPELLGGDGDGGGSSGAEFARLGLADLERVVERVSARRTAT